MPTETTDEAFLRLKAKFSDVVGSFIETNQPYALLDYPNYDNIGDSAIWLGNLAFFDEHAKRSASFVGTHYHDLTPLASAVPDGPIFLSGGGNFGDIWTKHQDFRFRVWEKFKGRPVVQLPQSIHYDDSSNIEATARAIDAHGAFTMLVRDQPSFDLAQKHFNCPVKLAPDAAVNLGSVPAEDPSLPILSFMRDDREAVWSEERGFLKNHGPIEDWPEVHVWQMPDRIKQKLLGLSNLTTNSALKHREDMYRRQAKMRLDAGVEALSRGQLIVSDRLHVHLVSALMRRPHLVLDNSYGKISRHIASWGNFGLGQRIETPEMLHEAVQTYQSQG